MEQFKRVGKAMAFEINILVAGYRELLTEHIRTRLERDGFRVSVAENIDQALVLTEHCVPDLVVMDLRLADSNRLDIYRALRLWRLAPVIFLTGDTDELDKVSLLASAVTKPGEIWLDEPSHRVSVRGQVVQLTPKEFALLRLLKNHAGQVVSTDEILSTIWGQQYIGARELVWVHISWLRQKLGIDPRYPHLIHNIRGVGYRFIPEESDSSEFRSDRHRSGEGIGQVVAGIG